MKRKSTTFYCFSPPVMLATFLIESCLAIYAVTRYRMSTLTRLTSALLICLATFQLAEYYVCGGIGVDAATWSRIGYVAITMLPPLGLHATQVVAKKPLDRFSLSAYGMAAIWISLFLFSKFIFSGAVCGGNYVIFRINDHFLYSFYYYGWLFVTMWLALSYSHKARPKVKGALFALVLGYAAFIVPTTTVNLLWPGTFAGVPSIMCGFAVIFAITLVMGVMPIEKQRSKSLALRRG